MKLKSFFATIVVALSVSQAASAETAECVFDKWRGDKKAVVQNWVGTGFVREVKGDTVNLYPVYGDTAFKADLYGIKENQKFTTYSFNLHERPAPGYMQNVRFSYRLYNNGKCEGFLRSRGFVDLTASGKVK